MKIILKLGVFGLILLTLCGSVFAARLPTVAGDNGAWLSEWRGRPPQDQPPRSHSQCRRYYTGFPYVVVQ